MDNLILDVDSYKSGHYLMYPPGSEAMYSYIEARAGHYENLVFYGALASLLDKLTTKVTMDMVEEANSVLTAHGEPFPYQGWKHVVDKLEGRIPLRIRALSEGSIVPVSIPLMTIESTCPEAFWMPGWFETMLMRVWYPITVATRSKYIKGNRMKFVRRHYNKAINELIEQIINEVIESAIEAATQCEVNCAHTTNDCEIRKLGDI